jgi:dimethylglycine dehydrogenase
MAGFSQGAAVGLALSNWIVDGDPGDDVFGMDVARFGSFAADDDYLHPLTSQFYARRFVMAYPNEELPAGRPLKTTPAYDDLADAGARFGVVWGLEVPLFFAPGDPDFEETPSLRRSNAHALVGEEAAAVRTAAGAYETAAYARYEVTGAGAEAWLDRVLACRMPGPGRVRLAPMLRETGTLMGDLSVTRLGDDRYWLVGSYYLQEWHLRWFRELLPPRGVELRNISDEWMGFSVSGPSSRRIVQRALDADLSAEAMPFLTAGLLDFDGADAVVARLSLTGELGYEVTVPTAHHRSLLSALRSAGDGDGLRLIGDRAIDSLRLEKAYGIWSAEFTQAYTPGMSGLDRFVAFDKGAFIGRDAALRERDRGPVQRLVLLEVDADGADASGDEPVWHDSARVGFVTSGAFGHHVGRSLALAYIDREVAERGPALSVHIVGEERPARILTEPPYDPSGSRMRRV